MDLVGLRAMVRRQFARLGVDIRLIANVEAEKRRVKAEAWRGGWRFLAERGISTVVDVGANTGQFASMIHEICPTARIFSFEPLPDCFRELEATLRDIPGARAFPVAIGATAGTVVMNQNRFSPSSSLLTMSPRHKALWPHTAEHSAVEVRVERLDDALSGVSLDGALLVKIDVQGFEQQVLEGARRILASADVVVLEVSFEALYDGQATFDGLYHSLRALGFEFRGNVDQFVDEGTGRIVFGDALFERPRP